MLVTYMGQDCKHNIKVLLSNSIRLKIEFCNQTQGEAIQFLVASELDSSHIQKESSSKEWKLKAKANIKTHQVSSKTFTHVREIANDGHWKQNLTQQHIKCIFSMRDFCMCVGATSPTFASFLKSFFLQLWLSCLSYSSFIDLCTIFQMLHISSMNWWFYNYNNEKLFLFFLMGQPKDNKHTSSFDLCVFLFLQVIFHVKF